MSDPLYPPAVRQEWTFHQNPNNPRFPQEIIDLIFSHFIEMQLSLHPFEPFVESFCNRGCKKYCWCHFWDLNTVELKQATIKSRGLPQHINYRLHGGLSPAGTIQQVDKRAAETAEIVRRRHHQAVPSKAIKKRRWNEMMSDDDFHESSFSPLGEYPTYVKDDDVIFLMYKDSVAAYTDPNGSIWWNRTDLPIAFGPGMPELRRVAMDGRQLASIKRSDVEQWSRNMDRYHLWKLCYTKDMKRRKVYSGQRVKATHPLRLRKAWRPSGEKTGLHLLPRADDLEEVIEDETWIYDEGESTDWFSRNAREFMEFEFQLWNKTRGLIPGRNRLIDMGDQEAMMTQMCDRILLHKKQLYWEDKHLDELNSRPNKPKRIKPNGRELFIHEFLPACEELFVIIPNISPRGVKAKFQDYLRSYSLGDVDPNHHDPSARDWCQSCICKHNTRPMVFGGANDFRYVEARPCRADIWGKLSAENMTKMHLEMWCEWQKVASTWDTEEYTRPLPMIRFLGVAKTADCLI